MTSTAPDGNVAQIPISFSDPVRRSVFSYGESFGIWSCQFSADGNEVVAGGSGKIFGLLNFIRFCEVFRLTDRISI
jgi:DDB1- and CUL4-associated factor 11